VLFEVRLGWVGLFEVRLGWVASGCFKVCCVDLGGDELVWVRLY